MVSLIFLGESVRAAQISLSEPIIASLRPDVLYYSFDEIDGNRVVDGSGNEGFGELRGGSFSPPEPIAGVNERFAQALHFRGGPKNDPGGIRNPFLMTDGHEKLYLDGRSFTMGVWVKLDDDSTQKLEILSKGASSTVAEQDAGYTWTLDRQEGDAWQMSVQIRDGQGLNPTRGTGYVLTITPGVWYHLGLVVNFDERTVAFYFNGVAQAPINLPADIGRGQDVFVVGERRTSSYVSDFRGSMDDLFITEGVHEFVPLENSGANATGH
jgi:Concanavalin A-like lectin/glucanases superfamily